MQIADYTATVKTLKLESPVDGKAGPIRELGFRMPRARLFREIGNYETLSREYSQDSALVKVTVEVNQERMIRFMEGMTGVSREELEDLTAWDYLRACEVVRELVSTANPTKAPKA